MMNPTQLKATGDLHEIVPNLFLGNMWATDPNVLNEHGIEVVLNVSRPETDVNKKRYKLHSHLVLQIDDIASASDKMIKEIIPKAMQYIDQFLHPSAPKQRRVLVHCVAGVSRSTTVVCAWLMKTYGMDRDKALTFVKSRRSIVHPNDGFMNVLKQWETYLKRFYSKSGVRDRRTETTSRGYNYPSTNHNVASGVVPLQYNNNDKRDWKGHLHHVFQGEQLDHYENMQNRQFERQFSIIPSEADTLVHEQNAPSYYREFEEKIYSNDDHFRHLY